MSLCSPLRNGTATLGCGVDASSLICRRCAPSVIVQIRALLASAVFSDARRQTRRMFRRSHGLFAKMRGLEVLNKLTPVVNDDLMETSISVVGYGRVRGEIN